MPPSSRAPDRFLHPVMLLLLVPVWLWLLKYFFLLPSEHGYPFFEQRVPTPEQKQFAKWANLGFDSSAFGVPALAWLLAFWRGWRHAQRAALLWLAVPVLVYLYFWWASS